MAEDFEWEEVDGEWDVLCIDDDEGTDQQGVAVSVRGG